MGILIADDEPLISDSLSRLLTTLGHDAAVASGPVAVTEQMRMMHLNDQA